MAKALFFWGPRPVSESGGFGCYRTQNVQRFRWGHERVNRELGEVMRKAYPAVAEIASERGVDLRTAAYILAIRRVGRAALARTHVTVNIPL